jgi:glyoxylase-like metal-dependent hydrolase (beta-lactamase superfamily II)
MRTSSIIRLCTAFLLLGGVWVAYTQMGSQPAKLDTIKVKDDLFVIHNNIVPGNSTALVTNEGVILVDDKFEVDHDGIMAELKKITDKPLKYVINTHHHADHSGGNVKMQAMNVQIIASEQARQNMVDGKQPGLPNIAIEHHAHVYLGGKNAELYYFGRAHTNGDIFVYLPAHKVLVTGDTFTFGKDTPILIDYAGGGSVKEWTNTLDGALKLDFDTVIPGHGTPTTRAELAKFRAGTVTLRNRIHDMVGQKKTRDEIGKAMQTEMNWGPLQMMMSLDGAIAELR